MAILTERNNEYEVKVINTTTGEPFKEYVKLGDRENHGDSKCERYIVARPGAKFKIQVTLMAGFCFKPFDDAQAGLCFGGSNTYCAVHIFSDKDPGYSRTEKDYNAVMDCINLTRYGESLVGAPFAFSSFDVDEDLSNETDVIGVDPKHIGHFTIRIYRRKVEEVGAEDSSMPSTNIWDAKKVDRLNFKKHGITSSFRLGQKKIPTVGLSVKNHVSSNSTILKFKFKYRTFEFLDHLDIVPYPPPLYYNPWKSLSPMERQWALKELQSLSKLQAQSAADNTLSGTRQSREWRSWKDMEPSERRNAFWKLQKEHKAFERGEAKQQLSDIPANKIIVLDDDGTVQRLAKTRSQPSVKGKTRVLQAAAKQETDLSGGEQALNRSRMTMKRGLEEEPIELDNFPLASTIPRPSAKKLRAQQEIIDVDAIEHTNIKQEVIDVDAIADDTMVLEKGSTIKYDLTEMDDDVVLTAPFPTPAVKDEDSNDMNTVKKLYRLLRRRTGRDLIFTLDPLIQRDQKIGSGL